MSITAKFGGTSLADAGQFKKVEAIIRSDPRRKQVVVSAPGKRFPTDDKITDLFKAWHAVAHVHVSGREIRKKIEDRYLAIVHELGLPLDLSTHFDEIARSLAKGASEDYAASRGEFLTAPILAKMLGVQVLDPTTCLRINKNGLPNSVLTYDLIAQAVGRAGGRCVMPGYYGTALDGKEIKTFSRGGSDISGAILARATGAELYENWTDVPGMYAADPKIIAEPRLIPSLTYREARELSYMGFSVIHPEALFPVQQKNIPTRILNTNAPEETGTQILADNSASYAAGDVVGIASRKGFTAIDIQKALMNSDKDFGFRVHQALHKHGVGYEHIPTGIDEMSVVIDQAQLNEEVLSSIVVEINRVCEPDEVSIDRQIALMAVVGNGMVRKPGVAARIFKAIDEAEVSNRLISQGTSERNIIIGVAEADLKRAVCAVYGEFLR